MKLVRITLAILASFMLIGLLSPAVQAADDKDKAKLKLKVEIVYQPSVTTIAPKKVGSTLATLRGRLTSLGTASKVDVYFELGATTEYGLTIDLPTMNSTGGFSTTITVLTESTTYHFRAVAVGDDTAYGLDKSFTTRKSGRGWWGRAFDEIFNRLMRLFRLPW